MINSRRALATVSLLRRYAPRIDTACGTTSRAFQGNTLLAFRRHGAGGVGGADALKCETIATALVDDPPQFLGQRDPGVARCEWRQSGELPGNFMGARKQLVRRQSYHCGECRGMALLVLRLRPVNIC